MPVWLFPLGLLGAVVLLTFATVYGYLLVIVWGLVLFPHGAAYVRRHSRSRDGENPFDDVDTHYWRTTLR